MVKHKRWETLIQSKASNLAVTPTLYHYTNAHGLVGIIKNRELWATEANYLNDPSEVSYASGVLISLLERRIRDGLGEAESERALQAVN